MTKALLYEIKKQIPYLLFATISLVLINWLSFNDFTYINEYNPNIIPTSPLFIYAIYGGILTLCSTGGYLFKMSKLHADLYLQLPIKKEKIYLIHYLVGIVKILIPITLAYLSTVLQISLHENLYDMLPALPYYFVLILCLISLYTIFSFAFTRCSNPADGGLNILAYMFILSLVLSTIYYLFNFDLGFKGFVFEPLTILTKKYLIYMNGCFEVFSTPEIVSLIVWSIITIILGFLMFYLIRYDKTEDTMQISKTWFGPKTMFPTITICSIILYVHDELFFLPLIGIIIIMYGLYSIHSKNFKIGKKNAIIFISSILIGLIIAIIKNLL